jgi:hypothetical protein
MRLICLTCLIVALLGCHKDELIRPSKAATGDTVRSTLDRWFAKDSIHKPKRPGIFRHHKKRDGKDS